MCVRKLVKVMLDANFVIRSVVSAVAWLVCPDGAHNLCFTLDALPTLYLPIRLPGHDEQAEF